MSHIPGDSVVLWATTGSQCCYCSFEWLNESVMLPVASYLLDVIIRDPVRVEECVLKKP